MAGPNQRTQLAAALLAFFLGFLGAHWYYLGDTRNGNFYRLLFFVSGALTLIGIGLLGLLLLGFLCLYDFITLLAMPPSEFERRYVR
jgi:TM2 domain-containing membrane protein YozV